MDEEEEGREEGEEAEMEAYLQQKNIRYLIADKTIVLVQSQNQQNN